AEVGADLDRLLSKVNSLGNLTLMLGKWNQTMSNKKFSHKKENCYKKSDLRITKNLSSLSSWTRDQLDARNENFFEKCNKLWDPANT
ncbi:HNH endonuclease family protein, partial [Candidatus Bathyarchaeota archaeon]|nr:HNH endonuclease family protein [Candidatus Bathyarchaeota archaeon]